MDSPAGSGRSRLSPGRTRLVITRGHHRKCGRLSPRRLRPVGQRPATPDASGEERQQHRQRKPSASTPPEVGMVPYGRGLRPVSASVRRMRRCMARVHCGDAGYRGVERPYENQTTAVAYRSERQAQGAAKGCDGKAHGAIREAQGQHPCEGRAPVSCSEESLPSTARRATAVSPRTRRNCFRCSVW